MKINTALLVLLGITAACSAVELNVTARQYKLAENSSAFLTELDNGYTSQALTIDTHRTALVMIDVWSSPDERLMENAKARMLPLLALARALGMLVIHAPSEAPEWPGIKVLPGELLITGTDGHSGSPSRCDQPIRTSSRGIRHVLMAGYDTNKCIIDKPCGLVSLSSELMGTAKLVLVRDATLGGYGWFGNEWYGQHATVNMLELGSWLPPAGQHDHGIPSVLLADLFLAAGAPANASALAKLAHPAPSASLTVRNDFAEPESLPVSGGGVALVVVSCSNDYANAGFRARVAENRARYLEPLLGAWRDAARYPIVHVLNGHQADGQCTPRKGEFEAKDNTAFLALLAKLSLHTLYYVGYAANTDMLFGVGGMQQFYSSSRYLGAHVPAHFWVDEATVGVENADTIADAWGKKAALAYRQPQLRQSRPYRANVVTSASLTRQLCLATPSDGPLLYSLKGMHAFEKATDAIEYDARASCGPSLVGPPTVSLELDASVATLSGGDRKILCLAKTVGTPYAVYQLRTGSAPGELLYQTANASGWSGTLAVPNAFTRPGQVVRLTVVHAGRRVAIYLNGTLAASSDAFAALDYADVEALWIGKRLDSEAWHGTIGNVLIRKGAWPPPNATGPPPPEELAALRDLYGSCGGRSWRYRKGTDAVGGGAPWKIGGDPCADGWFGVRCSVDGDGLSRIVQLFPNTRHSGNELDCELPPSIGNLRYLEHLYTSNDATPSTLHGPIPRSIGNLTRLKCVYFSHNKLSGAIPREIEELTELQVLLMRCNELSGPLIDFSRLTKLRNVWFDTNQLTGTLASVGSLPQLTFLQASNNPGIAGALPASLCALNCRAGGTNVSCAKSLPSGCCRVPHCGAAPPAPPPPPPSMGECFPQ